MSEAVAKPNLITARVNVRFLSAAEGGRSSPVNTGYRVLVVFGQKSERVEYECRFDFHASRQAVERDGEKWLPLNVEDEALLVVLVPERKAPVIVPGVEFEIREGSTLVGLGCVLDAPINR